MIRSALYVTSRTSWNRIVARLKRLRNPRYLVSFLAGMAYLWFFAFRHLFAARSGPHVIRLAGGFGVDVVAILVLAMMVLAWALPGQEGGLTFSEAEVQFLFPAPITRRQLLIYKIIRQQPQVLISAAVIGFLGFRHAKFVGVWLTFVTLSIYFTFVALGRARLKLMGIGFLIRLLLVAVAVGAIGFALDSHFDSAVLRRVGATFQENQTTIGLESPLRGPLVATILFIPRLFGRAVVPADTLGLLIGCGVLLVLGALFLELAVRMNVSFEDASIRASQRRSARNARRQSRQVGRQVTFPRMPPPFPLPAQARPEVAILWKNLTAGLRIASPWLLIVAVFAAYLIGQSIYSADSGVRTTMATLALALACIFPFLGSRVFTQDMRLDLPRIELLKSYPIRGDRLVAAEIAAPLVFVAVTEIVLLVVAAMIFRSAGATGKMAFFATGEFIVTALMLATPICATQLLICNAVPILLPGWAMRPIGDQRGFVVIGQRLLTLAANLLVLGLFLIPAGIVGGLSIFVATQWLRGSVAMVAVATVPPAALLFAEVWMGIRLLGAQFEKIDVTNEIDTVPV